MMNIEKDLLDIKRSRALEMCFSSSMFDASYITRLHGSVYYPNRKTLSKAHCVNFSDMKKETILELKSLAREAIYYEQPWWKIF